MKHRPMGIIAVSILATLAIATAPGSHAQEEVGGRQISTVTYDNQTLVSPVLCRMADSIGLLALVKQAKTSRWWYAEPSKRGWPLYGPWVAFPYNPATGTFGEGKQVLNDLAASLFGHGSLRDPKYHLAAGGSKNLLFLVSEVPIDGPPSDIALAKLEVATAVDSLTLKGWRSFRHNELRGGREEPYLSFFLDSPDLLVLPPSGRLLLAGNSGEASLWLTLSEDGGSTWHDLQLLGPRYDSGIAPLLLRTAEGLVLLYIDQTRPLSLSELESKALHKKFFRGTHKMPGPIAVMRSPDAASWATTMEGVAGARDVDSFAACVGPSGRLFIVYSRRDQQAGHLYLTTSAETGRTWSVPVQLTDGAFVDAYPSVIATDGKLIVAFTRFHLDGTQLLCYTTVPIQ
jgi:hypothetical protein